jgi:uncharacterized repeat protein (TIGR01451 family)
MGEHRYARVATAVLAVAALHAPMAAVAQVPADEADFRAFANGTVLHAEAIEQPELSAPESIRVIDAEAAFSAAAVDSAGLPAQQTTEFGGTFQPGETAEGDAVAGTNAYGRGYGLDASIAQEGQQQGQLTLAGLAEATAPPSSGLMVNELGPVPGDPLAYASLVRGEAEAIWGDTNGACLALGDDLSYGKGLAAEAHLIDTDGTPDGEGESPELEAPLVATEHEDPEREVSTSMSHTFFAAQTDAEGTVVGDALAVVAETRQTIAPVTLFAGTENAFTIEFLGEWVLRAVATGVPGTAHVHYGPGEVSPETPILRVITDTVETLLTFQDLLGGEGLVIDGLPLAYIALGEDPRAIGGDAESTPTIAADGTSASAAVDVVRIQLLSDAGLGEAAEIRVGHMEVSAQVPAGGILCDLPVSKSVDKPLVQPGDTFVYTVTVQNPYQCVLSDVRIVDTIQADAGVTWTVTGTDPQATSVSNSQIVWEGLGPINPGESLSVTATVDVGDDSAAGKFLDRATATGVCSGGPVDGRTDVETSVDLTGEAELPEPTVTPATGTEDDDVVAMPRTGATVALSVAALGMLGLVFGLRRRAHEG